MKKLSKEEVLRIVREMHAKLDVIYGDRLKGVYLYGSYVRDEAREDSDIDVAVVISGIEDRWLERDKVGDITADISLRENCLLTAFVMSDDEKSRKPYSIHRNIDREGIPV
jgi:predicted nucleotidyltransferase